MKVICLSCGSHFEKQPAYVKRSPNHYCSSSCFGLSLAGLSDTARTTHGHSSNGNPSGAYRSWGAMLNRCYSSSQDSFEHYGGRGISVCERWRSFDNFLADMGDRPTGHTLDRINCDENYAPDNCRWATNEQQARNRRNTIMVEINGAKRTLKEWCAEFGLPYMTVYNRIRHGWTAELAITDAKDGRTKGGRRWR